MEPPLQLPLTWAERLVATLDALAAGWFLWLLVAETQAEPDMIGLQVLVYLAFAALLFVFGLAGMFVLRRWRGRWAVHAVIALLVSGYILVMVQA